MEQPPQGSAPGCPACGAPCGPEHPAVVCAGCGREQHAECWGRRGRCGRCGEARGRGRPPGRAGRAGRDLERTRAEARRRLGRSALLALGFTALGVAAAAVAALALAPLALDVLGGDEAVTNGALVRGAAGGGVAAVLSLGAFLAARRQARDLKAASSRRRGVAEVPRRE